MKTTPARPQPATRFTLPPGSAATSPPEARGLMRDEVRLMVAEGQRIEHTQFRRLADHLRRGDLLVVNTSATVPAAVSGFRRSNGAAVVVHFSGPESASGSPLVELRDGRFNRIRDGRAGEQIELPHGVVLILISAWPEPETEFGSRLWVAGAAVETSLPEFLQREGRTIAYDHVAGRWPLSDYQTIFATHPGSAEMVSAGRPFSDRVLAGLSSRGVRVAPLMLHTGVSSLEPDELPLPERYAVPASTARLVNRTRAHGGRIIAVGTTVTRALETVADADSVVHPGRGVTDLVIGPGRGPRVVNGLITGWHEPEASHLLLLEAIAGPELVGRAYAAALEPMNGGYRWHEFGDSCLFLPGSLRESNPSRPSDRT